MMVAKGLKGITKYDQMCLSFLSSNLQINNDSKTYLVYTFRLYNNYLVKVSLLSHVVVLDYSDVATKLHPK